MANIQSIEDIHLYDEQEKKMKVLVAGSSGWIGGYVLKELLKNPWVEIIAPISVGSFPKIAHERITYTTKRGSEIEPIPDAIIYLSWPHLDYYDSPNHIRFAADSFDYLKQFVDKGVRNITVTGTCFEYGKIEGPVTESGFTLDLNNNYAIGKDTLRRMLSTLDIDLKWLRLFYLYGEGQRKQSLVPRFLKAIENKEPTFEVSGLNKIRDYLEVSEAAKYIVACAMQVQEKGIINVCSGAGFEIKSILRMIAEGKGQESPFLVESNESYLDYASDFLYGDNEKLKRIIK